MQGWGWDSTYTCQSLWSLSNRNKEHQHVSGFAVAAEKMALTTARAEVYSCDGTRKTL